MSEVHKRATDEVIEASKLKHVRVTDFSETVRQGTLKHPKPAGSRFDYGTAGFRTKSNVLDPVMFRVGILAALRSLATHGQTVGVMITASHNPIEDNGAKVVDPSGEILNPEWEVLAVQLANAEDQDLPSTIETIARNNHISLGGVANVCVGRDSRPSSRVLCDAVMDGAHTLDAKTHDYGEITTPQLHFITLQRNVAPEMANESSYIRQLVDAFKRIVGDRKQDSSVIIDGANGIGAPKAALLAQELKDVLPIEVINDGSKSTDILNHLCGADFVKVSQKPSINTSAVPNQRYAALDGDADRLIYFSFDEDGSFYLLDGDRIGALMAQYVISLIKTSGISLNVGVVQTAYANGASTDFLQNSLNISVKWAKTGVKHLHHEAKSFDIGIYFEANGHGTILFSQHAVDTLQDAKTRKLSKESHRAVEQLEALNYLINQIVGDALSDMLVVEAILLCTNQSIFQWNSMYRDLPNRLMKVVVKDRRKFETTDAERRLLVPTGLQEKIDSLVQSFPKARSFVRPSGTEDVVRVYAEAATDEAVDALVLEVARLVFDNVDGVGARP